MNQKTLKFGAAIFIQILILIIFLIIKGNVVLQGQDLFLNIQGYDPRDPFRGDYITFAYSDLIEIRSSYYRNDKNLYDYNYQIPDFKVGDTVYLFFDNKSFNPVRGAYLRHFSNTPNNIDNLIMVKGTIKNIKNDFNNSQFMDIYEFNNKPVGEKSFEISLGAEEYFIPERTGLNANFLFDRSVSKTAHLKVDEKGNLILRAIYVDGKKWPN
jgi:uncharacterized membrane-anchored protein